MHLVHQRGILCSLFIILSVPCTLSQVTWQQIGNDILGSSAMDRFGADVTLNADATIMAIGSRLSTFTGRVAVYEFDSGSWNQLGQTIEGINAYDEAYRTSLNDAGNILAVSSPGDATNGTNAGKIAVYEFNGTYWVQLGQNIYGSLGGHIGSSLKLNGDGTRLATNLRYSQSGGECKIYQYSAGLWTQLGSTIHGEISQYFAYGVTMNAIGDIVVLGSPYDDTIVEDGGSASVFAYNGSDWYQMGSTIYYDTANSRFGGRSPAINGAGNIMAIEALQVNNNGGLVRTFEYNGTEWNQFGQDIIGSPGDYLAEPRLNAKGDILAVPSVAGDIGETDAGYIRVFHYNGTWNQLGQTLTGPAAAANLGRSVALSSNGRVLAGGAEGTKEYGDFTGSVMVYELQGWASNNPTAEPSLSPTNPTNNPSLFPSEYPTNAPSSSPINYPTSNPSKYPTTEPTIYPTKYPSYVPTAQTMNPSINPTLAPSASTANPSISPTVEPTVNPTRSPTCEISTEQTECTESFTIHLDCDQDKRILFGIIAFLGLIVFVLLIILCSCHRRRLGYNDIIKQLNKNQVQPDANRL